MFLMLLMIDIDNKKLYKLKLVFWLFFVFVIVIGIVIDWINYYCEKDVFCV